MAHRRVRRPHYRGFLARTKNQAHNPRAQWNRARLVMWGSLGIALLVVTTVGGLLGTAAALIAAMAQLVWAVIDERNHR